MREGRKEGRKEEKEQEEEEGRGASQGWKVIIAITMMMSADVCQAFAVGQALGFHLAEHLSSSQQGYKVDIIVFHVPFKDEEHVANRSQGTCLKSDDQSGAGQDVDVRGVPSGHALLTLMLFGHCCWVTERKWGGNG